MRVKMSSPSSSPPPPLFVFRVCEQSDPTKSKAAAKYSAVTSFFGALRSTSSSGKYTRNRRDSPSIAPILIVIAITNNSSDGGYSSACRGFRYDASRIRSRVLSGRLYKAWIFLSQRCAPSLFSPSDFCRRFQSCVTMMPVFVLNLNI